MRKIFQFIFVLLLLGQKGLAQNISLDQNRFIDSLTAHWDQKGKPGGALAILYQGKVLAQKTRGLAKLSENKKN